MIFCETEVFILLIPAKFELILLNTSLHRQTETTASNKNNIYLKKFTKLDRFTKTWLPSLTTL